MTHSEKKQRYLKLKKRVAAILFASDPAELNFGFNSDEYDPEAETIVAGLEQCLSEEDVAALVRRELDEWFDEETAASEKIPQIAAEIWKEARAINDGSS